MYGQIHITLADGSCLTTSTQDHDFIYSWMLSHGYDHETAANLAGWADLAGANELYDLSDDGSEDSLAEIWCGGEAECC